MNTGEFFLDLTDTTDHARIIDKATEVARQIPETEAVILRGSLAAGNGDCFSDIIELLILCSDSEQLNTRRNKFLSAAHLVGPVIHDYPSSGVWKHPDTAREVVDHGR